MKESVIEVLSDREHVLLRPQIYIGDTTTSLKKNWVFDKDKNRFVVADTPFNEGFYKLYSEIIDNAIDEYIKTNGAYGNKIEVYIKDRNHIIVKDNGRGVPTSLHPQFKNKTSFEIAFTFLKAGSNFHKGTEKSESDTNTGLNGVGVSLVNILSTTFNVTTENKNARYILKCSDHMSKISCKEQPLMWHVGTTVEAVIDMDCFENSELITKNDVKLWCFKRLTELHTFYPGIDFYFNDQKLDKTIFDFINPLYNSNKDNKGNNLTIIFKQNNDECNMSYVNGLNTYDGGSHLNYIEDTVYSLLHKKINKKYKTEFKVEDIQKKFLILFSLNNFPNPKFATQNKTKLITPRNKIKDYVNDQFIEKSVNYFLSKFENEIEELVQQMEDFILGKIIKKDKKARMNIPKLIEANTKFRKEAILFITEGLSASGMFIRSRNKSIHACYPLRGKILNVYEKTSKKMVESQELKQLMQVIGLEVGKIPANLNYGKICIMTDADPDGDDIFSLLCILFYKYWPDLFEKNMIYRIHAPLIVATKGKEKRVYYTLEEYNNDLNYITQNKWATSYYKGLGKMSEDDYREMLNNPTESLITINDAEKTNKIFQILFGEDTDQRKNWLQGEEII